MKQWRCTVCDFIHKGDSLPENCPMCGSESSLFVAAGDETTPAVSDGQTDADGALRWQCVVCGYIHTGPEPPDKCPVCGADRSQFVCLDRETEATETPTTTATSETLYGLRLHSHRARTAVGLPGLWGRPIHV
jgi:rubredoxin